MKINQNVLLSVVPHMLRSTPNLTSLPLNCVTFYFFYNKGSKLLSVSLSETIVESRLAQAVSPECAPFLQQQMKQLLNVHQSISYRTFIYSMKKPPCGPSAPLHEPFHPTASETGCRVLWTRRNREECTWRGSREYIFLHGWGMLGMLGMLGMRGMLSQ